MKYIKWVTCQVWYAAYKLLETLPMRGPKLCGCCGKWCRSYTVDKLWGIECEECASK